MRTHTPVTHSQVQQPTRHKRPAAKKTKGASASSATHSPIQEQPAKPLLLDLFCGAGGAGMGYSRAGFDVVGVDLVAQPHYPFVFRQGDALACLDALLAGREWGGCVLEDFAAIHASPPCQGYSVANNIWSHEHPMLIDAVRAQLRACGLPWVIENVNGAWRDMPSAIRLCGTFFGLKTYRHRLFESSHLLFAPGHCTHPSYLMPGYLCIYGHQARGRQTGNTGNKYVRANTADARAAMAIDWMNRGELSQAIPPAYTEWIGRQLMAVIAQGRAA